MRFVKELKHINGEVWAIVDYGKVKLTQGDIKYERIA